MLEFKMLLRFVHRKAQQICEYSKPFNLYVVSMFYNALCNSNATNQNKITRLLIMGPVLGRDVWMTSSG